MANRGKPFTPLPQLTIRRSVAKYHATVSLVQQLGRLWAGLGFFGRHDGARAAVPLIIHIVNEV